MSSDLLDVNVLVALLRRDSPHHESASRWARDNSGRRGEVVVLAETLSSVVRLLSNDRIWREPTSPDRAVSGMGALIEALGARVIGADIRCWREFAALAGEMRLSTRTVPDAFLVAVARTLGARLVTFDRGLARYPGVEVEVLG